MLLGRVTAPLARPGLPDNDAFNVSVILAFMVSLLQSRRIRGDPPLVPYREPGLTVDRVRYGYALTSRIRLDVARPAKEHVRNMIRTKEAAMSFRLRVSGPAACFPRPEFKHDLVSYDVMTPMAARGIFEAIHWTPSIQWLVSSIVVLNPIRFELVSREQSPALHRETSSAARCMRLVDVAYLLKARIEMTDRAGPGESIAQHLAMFRRRAERQTFFKAPFLGLRDLPATVILADSMALPTVDDGLAGRKDLGWMLHDRDPMNLDALYFRPVMIDGVIETALSAGLTTAE